jgi:High-affinity nickel-transport protein
VLFGLGCDTATEITLLVLAGIAVFSGLPFYAILSLPILFAAGMCLFDTLDGCFMNFAHDWAFAKPVRKVFYNMTITGLSVFVAFFIDTIELLGLLGQEFNPTGGFWDFLANFDPNKAGFVIVGIFVLTWAVALAVWHFGHIEQNGTQPPPGPTPANKRKSFWHFARSCSCRGTAWPRSDSATLPARFSTWAIAGVADDTGDQAPEPVPRRVGGHFRACRAVGRFLGR